VGVVLGGDADVAALGVGQDDEAGGACGTGDALQRRPPRRAEALEAGGLRLGGDARGPRRVDQGTAVRRDRCGRPLGGRAAVGRRAQRLRPQPRRVRVESQDDLGLAVGNGVGQAVGELRPRRRRGGLGRRDGADRASR
jgi:hypothetical protein